MKTRILIIGSGVDDKYIGNCLRACKNVSPDMCFDFISTRTDFYSPFRNEVGKYVPRKKDYSSAFYKIPKLRGLCNQSDLLGPIHQFIKHSKQRDIEYDVCQIHALNPAYAKIVDELKFVANCLVIFPCILRAKQSAVRGLRKLALKSDVITCPKGIRFEKDIISILPSWITYPQYEVFGSPFYIFSNYNELSQTIVTAVNDAANKVSHRLANDIALTGWRHKAEAWMLYKNSEK